MAGNINLFGFKLTNKTLQESASEVVNRSVMGMKTRISFLNAHCVNVSFANKSYKNALRSSDIIFADGSGIRYAAKLSGKSIADNVNGTDLFPVICKEAASKGVSIYLLGGRPGIAAGAAESMRRKYPDLKIAGVHHGYLRRLEDEEQVISEINESGAGIVLVGFGVPMQELWIQQNHWLLNAPVTIGVGGLFDYYSNRIPRAPQFIRNIGFEWVWRLYQEPSRMWRRYLIGNAEFMARAFYLKYFKTGI